MKPAHSIDDCCKAVLKYIRELDGDWARRVDILIAERRFSDKQAIVSLAGFVLANRLHMTIPAQRLLEVGEREQLTDRPHPCPVCQRIYAPVYLGQPVCGNFCAELFYNFYPGQGRRHA